MVSLLNLQQHPIKKSFSLSDLLSEKNSSLSLKRSFSFGDLTTIEGLKSHKYILNGVCFFS